MSLVPYNPINWDVALTYGKAYAARAAKSFAKGAARRALQWASKPRMSQARRARLSTGVPRGTATSHRASQLTNVPQTHPLNTQQLITSNAIARDVGSVSAGAFRVNINNRLRGIAYISGIKVQIYFQNLSTSNEITIRWALVKPKNNNPSSLNAGWFRDYGTSRDTDFTNATTATELQNLPISTDKYFIYKQGKFTLGHLSATGSGSSSNRRQRRFLKRFIPIRRQIRYNDDLDDSPEDEFVFVHWGTKPFENPITTTADQYATEGEVLCYFRNPF